MRGEHRENTRVAILLVLGFTSVVSLNGVAAKLLGAEGVSAPQITVTRFLFQVIVAGTVLAASGIRLHRPPDPAWAFLLRGVLITIGSVAIYAGLAYVPLAEAIAVLLASPLVITAGSALVLGERVGPWRWSAVAAGFAGALMIVGPNFAAIGPAAALPALAAVCFAASSLLTRRYAVHGSAFVFQFTTAATGCAILLPLLAVGAGFSVEAIAPVWPTWTETGLLAVVGILGMITNLMLTQAFRIAPPSALAPFMYLEIVGAGIAGYLVFADVPNLRSLIGAAIVVGAGLVVWWRESAGARRTSG